MHQMVEIYVIFDKDQAYIGIVGCPIADYFTKLICQQIYSVNRFFFMLNACALDFFLGKACVCDRSGDTIVGALRNGQ